MVDAVEIRIMATIVPPSTFEPQSTVIIGTFVVFVIFGRKLHPTRNMNKSKKKITYITLKKLELFRLRLEQLLRIFRALQTSHELHISMNAR